VTLRSVQQDEQVRNLMQQKQTLEADISKARGDHSAAQTEVVQMEKKLSNTKERLTLAISKGKSVVQQRDAVKQALKEKTEDLEHLISSHAESIRAKDMALHEAEVKASSMAAMADRASLLDVDLAVAQDTILSLEHALHEARSVTQGVQLKLETMAEIPQELGLAAKIEWLTATLTAEQSKAEDEANNVVTLLTELGTSKQESEALAEQVAELSGKCVKLKELVAKESSEKTALASELAIVQDTILSLENAFHEARSVTQDVQLKLETMGDIPPELGLVAKIEWVAATLRAEQSKAEDLANNAVTLLTELGTSKQESEMLTEQVAELNGKCVKLEELVAEESSEKTALASEIDVLQRMISDRDLAMEAELAAHLKLQLDISVAMKLLDSVSVASAHCSAFLKFPCRV
jgi:chromosome segregation ATPase